MDVLNTRFHCVVTSKTQSSKRSWEVLRAIAKNWGSEGRVGRSTGTLSGQGAVVLTALRCLEMGSLAKTSQCVVTTDIVFGSSFIVFVKLTLSSCVRK